jgi:hypothetical protein
VVESIKPPTDRDLKSVADEKHEDEEEEGAHDTSLSCGAVREECARLIECALGKNSGE